MADAGKFLFDTDKIVEFERYWTELSIIPISIQSSVRASSGKVSIQEFYDQTKIKVARDQVGGSVFNKLKDWFAYVKDGTAFSFWVNRFIGFYLGFDDYSINTNDGNAGTFTRTGTAKYIDENGILQSASANTPAYPAGKFGAGIRVENSASNYLYRTQAFGTAPGATPPTAQTDQGWVATNMSVTTDQIPGLDGTVGADKVACTSVAGGNLAQLTDNSILHPTTMTFSVWVKTVTGTMDFSLSLYDSVSGQLSSENHTATTEWQRFSVTHTTTGSGNYWGVKIHLNDIGDTIYCWGAQMESGTYPLSYKKDTDSTGNESLYFDVSENWYSRKWSFSCWFKPPWTESESTQRRILNFYDGSTSLWYVELSTGNQLKFVVKYEDNSGPLTVTFSGNPYGITQNAWNHLVITVDSTISNGVKAYINGSEITGSSADPFVPDVVDKVYIGSSGTPSLHANCDFDEILFEMNKIIDQAEVYARYNATDAHGIEQNYFASVKIVNPQLESSLHQGGIVRRFSCELEEVL